jgi:hypothetical protein
MSAEVNVHNIPFISGIPIRSTNSFANLEEKEDLQKITNAFLESVKTLQEIPEWTLLIKRTEKEFMNVKVLSSNLKELATAEGNDLYMDPTANTIGPDQRWFRGVRSEGFNIEVIKKTFRCAAKLLQESSTIIAYAQTQIIVNELSQNMQKLCRKAIEGLAPLKNKHKEIAELQDENLALFTISEKKDTKKKTLLRQIQEAQLKTSSSAPKPPIFQKITNGYKGVTDFPLSSADLAYQTRKLRKADPCPPHRKLPFNTFQLSLQSKKLRKTGYTPSSINRPKALPHSITLDSKLKEVLKQRSNLFHGTSEEENDE